MPQNRAILLVDDSEDDRILLKRSLVKCGVANPVREVHSGQEAIEYLAGTGRFSDREKFPAAGIVLLDLKMPGIDGFGVLKWIRDKYADGGLLVVVLSRLEEIKTINQAYAMGAQSFLTKPGNSEELDALIHTFHDYWVLKNMGPSSEEPGENKKGLL